MKKLTDFIFYASWQVKEMGLKVGAWYLAANDLSELKAGDIVKFEGFEDVDNHYGRFVFTDKSGNVRVVDGDFSSQERHKFKLLKDTLGNVS